MKELHSFAAGLLALTVAAAADATPIDFRDAAFTPGAGVSHHAVGFGGYSFVFDTLNVSGFVPDGSLYWDGSDGFGIIGAGWENDEIELPEVMSLSFGETLFVDQFRVSDLFVEGRRAEQGFYSLDGGSVWQPFAADGLDSNGEMAVPVGAFASQILFTSAGRDMGVRRDGHEYSLAGVGVERILGTTAVDGPAVPEPSAALLFAAGALLIRRRTRA